METQEMDIVDHTNIVNYFMITPYKIKKPVAPIPNRIRSPC